MENRIINFSSNWNGKLENKAFTTIRLHNPKKHVIGRTYDIELNGNPKGKAEIKAINVLKMSQLSEFACYIDTGYSRSETVNILKRMYKHINLETSLFDFCLLVYTESKRKENKASHPTLAL